MKKSSIASVILVPLVLAGVGVLAANAVPVRQAGGPAADEPTLGDLKFPIEIFQAGLVNRGVVCPEITQTFGYTVGGRLVQRHKRERAAATDAWYLMEGDEKVSYRITALTTRLGGDEVFVAGIRDDGSCVIERWTYLPRKNGWQVTCTLPPGSAPIGTPAPAATCLLAVASGEAWEAVSTDDMELPAATRREVYSSPGGPFYGLAVDPQGRYLLFFDVSTEQLLRIDLSQRPVVPAVVFSGVTYGIKTAGNMQVMDFTGEGRKCLIRPMLRDSEIEPEVYLLGTDANNDGVFESWVKYSSAEWDTSVYSDWDKWRQFWEL